MPKKETIPKDVIYGKVPPQAAEVEEVILGAIMLEKNAYAMASSILQAECFYKHAHQLIFKACSVLAAQNQQIDTLTVVEQLKKTNDLENAGGAYGVVKLTNAVVSSAHLVSHCRIVYEKYVKREQIRIAGEILTNAYADATDAFDLLDWSQNALSGLSVKSVIKPYQSLQELGEEAVKKIYELKGREGDVTGVPTGIKKLDDITQGWQPTDLIIIAARPAVGKSAVAGNLALNAAIREMGVGVFSLEMSAIQWVFRLLSKESEIQLWDLKRGRIGDEEINKLSGIAFKKWEGLKIFFDDSSGLDVYQLKSKARMMVEKEGVKLLIVDYLQLVGGGKVDIREQEVAFVSRQLKQLAKELQVPVIALSQLNRKGDSANPRLSDLRESGAIEQDADCVIFLVDPSEEDVAQDATLKDSILIRFAKHRNGTLEDVPVKFVKSIQKIMNESEYDQYCHKVDLSPGKWKPVPVEGRLPYADDKPF